MEKEVSCINSRFILDYMKDQNNGDCSGLLENLHPEIDALPDSETFLRDPHNWISCGVVCEMLERAKSILDDEEAPYKMARFAVENTSLGYAQRIIFKALWSSKLASSMLRK